MQQENSKQIHQVDKMISASSQQYRKYEMDEEHHLEIDGKHSSQMYLDPHPQLDIMSEFDPTCPNTPVSTPRIDAINKFSIFMFRVIINYGMSADFIFDLF